MNKIKVITDSTADIPKSVLEANGVEVLPLIIDFEGKDYVDGVDINFTKLAQMMEYSDEFPKTAGINPQRFMECYKKYLDEGYKIISIHLSSKMSGTCQAAFMAKEMLETEDIVVIDSLNVTSGLGLLVLKACKLRDQGIELKDIENSIKQTIPHVKSSLVFGSLDNLVKGGRLSKAAGIVGNLLGIKLILEVSDGEMKVREKVRGTKKAVKNAMSYIEQKGIKEDEYTVLLTSGDEELKNLFKNSYDKMKTDYIEAEVGCTVGVHAGTSASGIFFIEKY
ncbi:DegV family protein [Hathewaya limosa]|uniref:DegV family protein with EDD domain n=1 Tax=Hathewaya limosa TaxID=1536 RepID=A0ABU0JU50_HATLI|nr:DegV family protein [Hathewaya limosa]AWZ47818.1 fatty acid-binding protein DegV [Clostridiaceae bacterium 14S0207]MDQ0480633.1 DegV family protein with EDD domain [Hathewaya limosa]